MDQNWLPSYFSFSTLRYCSMYLRMYVCIYLCMYACISQKKECLKKKNEKINVNNQLELSIADRILFGSFVNTVISYILWQNCASLEPTDVQSYLESKPKEEVLNLPSQCTQQCLTGNDNIIITMCHFHTQRTQSTTTALNTNHFFQYFTTFTMT